MSEKIEATDYLGNKTGELVDRKQMRSEGVWHRARHVHFINSKKGTITFQQRALNKAVCAGKLDTAAAGHYVPGETPDDALREVKEELGVTIKRIRQNLVELIGPKILNPTEGKMIDIPHPSLRIFEDPDRNIRSNGLADVSFLDSELSPDNYVLQRSEVLSVAEFSTQDVRELLRRQREKIKNINGVRFQKNGSLQHFTQEWNHDDFWPTADNYHGKAAAIAYQISCGETEFDGM